MHKTRGPAVARGNGEPGAAGGAVLDGQAGKAKDWRAEMRDR